MEKLSNTETELNKSVVQPVFICLNSAIPTVEKSVKYV